MGQEGDGPLWKVEVLLSHTRLGFSPNLLVEVVSYSQGCLIMRKKELPFVHIQDFWCHKM